MSKYEKFLKQQKTNLKIRLVKEETERVGLMTSHDLMNINPEAYKSLRCTKQNMWRLNDIIPIIYIIYTHNFYTDGSPRISSLQLYEACKDLVQHDINIEIGVTFSAKFLPTLCC